MPAECRNGGDLRLFAPAGSKKTEHDRAARRYAVDAMADRERRNTTDRRRQARGGRREADAPGSTPLVLIVTPRAAENVRLRTVLEDAGFATAPCDGGVAALRAARDLVPDVIVADVHEGVALRGRLPVGRTGRSIPIVDLTGRAMDALLIEIRLALRRRP